MFNVVSVRNVELYTYRAILRARARPASCLQENGRRVAHAGPQYRLILVCVYAMCHMYIYMAAPQGIAFAHEVLRVILYIAACVGATVVALALSDQSDIYAAVVVLYFTASLSSAMGAAVVAYFVGSYASFSL